MSRAINVLVDNTGRVYRCDGYSQVSAGDCVVWGDGQAPGLAVKNGWLYLLSEVGTLTAVQAVSPGVRHISAVRWMDRIYWTTGLDQGFIKQGQAFSWGREGFDESVNTNKKFYAPPPAQRLEAFAGRMIVGSGGSVHYSELWEPGLWRDGANHLAFAGEISLLASVADGLWVSDSRFIYWLNGLDPNGWIPIQKAEYPAINGQVVKIPAEETSYDGLIGTGMALKVGTPRGILTLGANGFIVNETLKNIEWDKPPYLMTALQGAAVKYGDHVYFTYEP